MYEHLNTFLTRAKPACWCALGLLAGLSACIVGQRGFVEFSAEYPLFEVQAVRFDLPDTPMTVRGDPLADQVELAGYWFSVGGTVAVAEANAAEPSLAWARESGFAELSALVPADLRELVDLEVGEITVPEGLDVELVTGLGNIEVAHVIGNVSVDIETGNIEIFGGDEGVAARTHFGDIEVRSPGAIDAYTAQGEVSIAQTGIGGNAIFAEAIGGSIRVELLADTNLALDIHAGGDIRVQTSTISTISRGTFHREVGNATVAVELYAPTGSVTVVLVDPE